MKRLYGIVLVLSLAGLLSASCERGEEGPRYRSEGISAVEMGTYLLSGLPAGQYSAITRISGNCYALVNDELNGGGILFADIEIGSGSGVIVKSYHIPEGTESSNTFRDPEAVAWYPGTGTMFVAGEKDQEILEYDMDGMPTGRRIEVPEEFSLQNVVVGRGFESLSYNHDTRLFWTVTESGIIKDADLRPDGRMVLRLQSFGEDLKAAGQYLYLTEPAERDGSSADSYAFGVSDILALDDGKLIVLEREVYVPDVHSMEPVEAILATTCRTRLFEVDPMHDEGDYLVKHPVFSCMSSLTDFANYEGVCFGPRINGRRTLLLVSDSQGRYAGYLNDWMKVLFID